MYWTDGHDILMVREVLALDPYSVPKGKERAEIWEAISCFLNASTNPVFSVSPRSVKDRLQLTLIKNYKKKMAEEMSASGIEVEPPSELDTAMEEIVEKYDASEREVKDQAEEKKEKLENDRRKAEEIRKQALERVGETKKRKKDEENDSKPTRSRRRGSDTITYLKEKSEQEMKIRQEELELKREENNQQNEMMQHLFEQQQQQQQQMQQQLMGLMQQQQQQGQALMMLLQEIVSKK